MQQQRKRKITFWIFLYIFSSLHSIHFEKTRYNSESTLSYQLLKLICECGYSFSSRHHFCWDCPFNWSQLNCHRRSGTDKFSYSSASVPRRLYFSWGHPFNWGHSSIGSKLNCHKGSGTGKFRYSSS